MLCIFIDFCILRNIMHFEDRESITTKQRGRTAHPLWDTKSATLTGVDDSNSTGGLARTASLAANLSSRMVSSLSVPMYRTSNLCGQSFAQCPMAPHWRQALEMALALRAASMSMGTGLPGEGWECANLAGGGTGAGLAKVDAVGTRTAWGEA